MTFELIAAMENELGVPITGVMLSHLGKRKAAALIAPQLSLSFYIQISADTPITFELGKCSGSLSDENTSDHEKLLLIARVRRTPRNGYVSGLPYLLLVAPLFIYAKPILVALGQNKSSAKTAQHFFRIYFFFYTFFSPRLIQEFLLVNFNYQLQAMYVSLISLAVTVSLEYLFAFVLGWRVAGLAYASGIGVVLTALGFTALVSKLFKDYRMHSELLTKFTEQDIAQIKGLMQEALPIVLVSATDVAMSFVLSIQAGWLGDDAIEKQNVATQFLGMNSLILAAATQTMATRVSQQVGKAFEVNEQQKEVRLIVYTTVISTLLIQAPLSLFVVVFPELFADIVSGEDVESVQLLLLASAVYALLDGVRFNLLQPLRALGDNKVSSFFSSLFLLLGASLSYLLSQYEEVGLEGLPLGMIAGAGVGAAFLSCRLEHVLGKIGEKSAMGSQVIVNEDTFTNSSLNCTSVLLRSGLTHSDTESDCLLRKSLIQN